jgi:excisionase family DNA binding protein
MVTSEKQVLTVSEAAAMLNAHPNSVRRWAEIGLLPHFRLGLRGGRRFHREDLEKLMESWQHTSSNDGSW